MNEEKAGTEAPYLPWADATEQEREWLIALGNAFEPPCTPAKVLATLRPIIRAQLAASDASARLWKETAQEALAAREKAEAAEFLNSSTTVIRLRDELAAEKARADRAVRERDEWKDGAAIRHYQRERDEARAQLARVRAETLADVTSILFLECQPSNGDLFSRVDDQLRALATKTEGGDGNG